MLTDIQDSLLAMCEGELVRAKIASQVLSAWHERVVTENEVLHAACRLAKLGYLKWRYQSGYRTFLSRRVHAKFLRTRSTLMIATVLGEKLLQKSTAKG